MNAIRKSSPFVLLLLLSGCGFEGELPETPKPPSPPTPPSQAGIQLSLSSSPIDAAVATDGGGSWSAGWTLGVQETSGIGGSIENVRATLTDPGGAELAETSLDASQVGAQLGGSNKIRGGSNQSLAMSLKFDFPEETPSGSLHVSLAFADDRGNQLSSAVDDVVQVCVPALLSPAPNDTLDNGCSNRENGILWEFDWADCANSDSYEIYVRQRSAQEPLDRPGLTSSSFTVLENRVVPEESRHSWFWKVRAHVNGVWGAWTPESDFEVEPVNADCVRP